MNKNDFINPIKEFVEEVHNDTVGDARKFYSNVAKNAEKNAKAAKERAKAKQEQIEALSLSDTVANVCLVFEPIIYENGKTLQTSIAENVMMPAEEDNIKQLLSILLDNAVLHSVPNAEISVTLAQDAQDQIRLSVANTAKDIPEEQLSHLFERFYRVDTEGSPNGSGLGLSIAKSIVKQLHGDLTVTSAHQLVTFTAVFRT